MTVSVIIPVYQHSRALQRCLRSLECQTFRDFDVTIVDDGSDPPLLVSVDQYDLRIRCIRQEHAGAPTARNRGVRDSASTFVLFCDADVRLRHCALEHMVRALVEHAEASYAYSRFRFGWKTYRGFPFDPERLRRMPYIHTTTLIRREHFPGFDESLRRFQDWDLWLTMLERGRTGVYIPELLFTIGDMHGTMSRWLPSFAYRLPWKTKQVRAYEDASAIVRRKHQI